MDMKWYAIMMIGIVACGMGAVAVIDYSHNQCRAAALQAGKSADEIKEICK
jgi:hypothetical protein